MPFGCCAWTGLPVGVLVLRHEPGALLIDSVVIDPAYQHRGLGRQLLTWGEHQAHQANFNRIRLYTNALMLENIRLYQRFGYQQTHREPTWGPRSCILPS
ncbi:MAG: GNAT family N-acetyltransferase [Gammaproteobacteria bacterium]